MPVRTCPGRKIRPTSPTKERPWPGSATAAARGAASPKSAAGAAPAGRRIHSNSLRKRSDRRAPVCVA